MWLTLFARSVLRRRYYWNTETDETSYDPPAGLSTLAAQSSEEAVKSLRRVKTQSDVIAKEKEKAEERAKAAATVRVQALVRGQKARTEVEELRAQADQAAASAELAAAEIEVTEQIIEHGMVIAGVCYSTFSPCLFCRPLEKQQPNAKLLLSKSGRRPTLIPTPAIRM